ncbi:MAG: hypothetical protein K0S65_3250 [Labilithrix sp.]|nr:hypothetical protein [Labilithrix sp.]
MFAAGLAACSTDNGAAEDPEEVPAEAPAREKKNDDDETQATEFEASFDEPDAGPNDDPTPPDDEDQCIDKDDPGGAENVAKALPATDDCDDSYKSVSGVAKGAVDLDFYKLSASDKTGCLLETDFEAQTAGTELCVFARCKNSTADAVTGCAQGVQTTSDIGMKGCCAAAPGKAVPEWDCSGITDDDSADFFLRVRQINQDKCLPYSFRYRY